MKIVVTGSSGGIGSEISKYLKSKSIELIELNSDIIDFSEDFELDVNDVSGLVHCAGINKINSYTDTSDNDLINIINVNTISFIRLCKKINFNLNSNIIAIGSLYASETKTGRLAYTISKHGLYGAVKTLAIEMSEKKCAVNMVSPGFVDTQLTRKNNSFERINELERNIPLGLTDAKEIAKICSYLLLENKSITGQNIIVDGGYSLIGI
jgi:3-oxoacyl-[acyl-carrier protein] reductase